MITRLLGSGTEASTSKLFARYSVELAGRLKWKLGKLKLMFAPPLRSPVNVELRFVAFHAGFWFVRTLLILENVAMGLPPELAMISRANKVDRLVGLFPNE